MHRDTYYKEKGFQEKDHILMRKLNLLHTYLRNTWIVDVKHFCEIYHKLMPSEIECISFQEWHPFTMKSHVKTESIVKGSYPCWQFISFSFKMLIFSVKWHVNVVMCLSSWIFHFHDYQYYCLDSKSFELTVL